MSLVNLPLGQLRWGVFTFEFYLPNINVDLRAVLRLRRLSRSRSRCLVTSFFLDHSPLPFCQLLTRRAPGLARFCPFQDFLHRGAFPCFSFKDTRREFWTFWPFIGGGFPPPGVS